MSHEQIINAVDNYKTEGDRSKADRVMHDALIQSYVESQHNGGKTFKNDVLDAQAEAKKLNLPDVQINFGKTEMTVAGEKFESINSVQRDWKAAGFIPGKTELFNISEGLEASKKYDEQKEAQAKAGKDGATFVFSPTLGVGEQFNKIFSAIEDMGKKK